MDLKKQIKVALGLETEDEIKLAFQAKTEDGTIVVSTADELAEGVDISVLTEDGTTILLPVGTYKLESGVMFRVDEEGIVAEVMEAEETPEEETETEEVEASEEKLEHEEDHKYSEIEERMTKLEEAIDEMRKELRKDKEEMSEELSEETSETTEEKSDSPKTVTTKTTEVVEFSAEDVIAELKAENEKLRLQLSESPADAPVNVNKFSSENKTLSKKEYGKLSRQEKFLYNLNKQ